MTDPTATLDLAWDHFGLVSPSPAWDHFGLVSPSPAPSVTVRVRVCVRV